MGAPPRAPQGDRPLALTDGASFLPSPFLCAPPCTPVPAVLFPQHPRGLDWPTGTEPTWAGAGCPDLTWLTPQFVVTLGCSLSFKEPQFPHLPREAALDFSCFFNCEATEIQGQEGVSWPLHSRMLGRHLPLPQQVEWWPPDICVHPTLRAWEGDLTWKKDLPRCDHGEALGAVQAREQRRVSS